jgi:hypothetical protein
MSKQAKSKLWLETARFVMSTTPISQVRYEADLWRLVDEKFAMIYPNFKGHRPYMYKGV